MWTSNSVLWVSVRSNGLLGCFFCSTGSDRACWGLSVWAEVNGIVFILRATSYLLSYHTHSWKEAAICWKEDCVHDVSKSQESDISVGL